MSENVAKISAEYSARVNKKFDLNHGRLFLVDYSKSCALQALAGLLSRKDYQSLFILVDDEEVANEFAAVLRPVVGEITVVNGYLNFDDRINALDEETLKSVGGLNEPAKMRKLANAFKKKYPRIIFTAEDCNSQYGTLIHRVLGKDDEKSGVYGGVNKKGAFCISDFIARCRYEFVVIDNIYGNLAFEPQEKGKGYYSASYERVAFLGNAYYTPITKSYKRLNNVVDASKKSVILSDTVVERDVVDLYAVLEILHGEFPYVEAKELVSSITSTYSDDCERVYNDVSYWGDDSILSKCLQQLKGGTQTVPAGIEALKDYLQEAFNYMSEEEIFLRAAYSQIQRKFSGKCGSLESVVDMLENVDNGFAELADCIYYSFLREPIKGELEGVLNTSHVSNMNEEQIAAMFEVFLRYGVYHAYPHRPDRCRVLRLKRDDSGFESFARNYSNYIIEDGYSYSIIEEDNPLLYKSVAIQRLLDGREQTGGIETPTLVVTKGDTLKLTQILKKLLPEYNCTQNIGVISQRKPEQKTVVVVSYALFRETALWLQVNSVVFFDVMADAVIMKNLVNKALRYGEVQVILLATYSDFSGHLLDVWQEDLLSEAQKAMPIDNNEICLKEGMSETYETVLEEIDEMYRLLENIVTYGQRKNIKLAAEKYNKILTAFTLKVSMPPEEMEQDFTYLVAMSRYFNGIFKNSTSIGAEGEEVLIHKRKFVKTVKEKKKGKKVLKTEIIEERTETEETHRVYFNVCAAVLRRICDIKKKNCNGCKEYERFMTNDFTVFSDSVEKLFERSKQFVKKMEQLHFMDQMGETIGSISDGEENKVDRLITEEIVESETVALEALHGLYSESKDKKLFSVDYNAVKTILDAARDTYCKLLKKYYATVMDIFDAATKKAKIEFETQSNSFNVADRKEV